MSSHSQGSGAVLDTRVPEAEGRDAPVTRWVLRHWIIASGVLVTVSLAAFLADCFWFNSLQVTGFTDVCPPRPIEGSWNNAVLFVQVCLSVVGFFATLAGAGFSIALFTKAVINHFEAAIAVASQARPSDEGASAGQAEHASPANGNKKSGDTP